ncbi:MAG: glycosyltransferase family 9 protein [Ignavibacteria bacterium]|nr:glycosyltransferase family 9 protein [Ignavibacteria bacterium]
MKQKRILIVRTDRVGDVVMITPMIREIRKKYPDSFIAALVQPNTSKILINNPYLDEIITDDLEKESYNEVVKKIRSYKFNTGLLVWPTERAAYQMFRAGVKSRIGVGRKLYEIITFMKSVSRNKYIPLRHEADYCMDLARKIGVVTDNYQPEIFVSDEEKIWLKKFLESKNIGSGTFKIILHTGSKNSAPNWSEYKYLELLKKIIEKFPDEDYRILLTAYEMTDKFKSDVATLGDKRIIDVSGDFKDLRDFIKIISGIDLMICSSTGPIHLADALNRKCIGISCHRPMSCVKLWGVVNKKSINLEVTKEYCDTYCSADKEECAFDNGISTDEVLKHIEIK